MIDSGFHDVLGQMKKLLRDSPVASLRQVEVLRDGENFTLHGSVSTYYLKQLAQETVRPATRGVDVINDVEVVSN